jgi:radical SAM superfamily enzyme YgiQ (UPF0313 family)
MRYKKILLIFPDYAGGHFGALRPPAGLGYIAESLIQNGYECEVVDMAVGFNRRYLAERLKAFAPNLVGISLMSFMYHNSYDIVSFVKELLPGIKVVAGGPHVSTFRKELLAQCEDIDYGIVLDGEAPLLELCEGKDLHEIGGLIYRQGEDVVFNGTRPFEKSLDNHPFPLYEGFALDRYVTEVLSFATTARLEPQSAESTAPDHQRT